MAKANHQIDGRLRLLLSKKKFPQHFYGILARLINVLLQANMAIFCNLCL